MPRCMFAAVPGERCVRSASLRFPGLMGETVYLCAQCARTEEGSLLVHVLTNDEPETIEADATGEK